MALIAKGFIMPTRPKLQSDHAHDQVVERTPTVWSNPDFAPSNKPLRSYVGIKIAIMTNFYQLLGDFSRSIHNLQCLFIDSTQGTVPFKLTNSGLLWLHSGGSISPSAEAINNYPRPKAIRISRSHCRRSEARFCLTAVLNGRIQLSLQSLQKHDAILSKVSATGKHLLVHTHTQSRLLHSHLTASLIPHRQLQTIITLRDKGQF